MLPSFSVGYPLAYVASLYIASGVSKPRDDPAVIRLRMISTAFVSIMVSWGIGYFLLEDKVRFSIEP